METNENMLKINDYASLDKREEKDITDHELDVEQFTAYSKEIQKVGEINEIERKEREIEANKKIVTLLREKNFSEHFIERLINIDLTNKHVGLLQILNLNDKDTEDLQELWQAKNHICKNDSFINSVINSNSSSSNLSQNGLYLKQVLSEPLIEALREILAKKPADPVEYLGHWLLHFKFCEDWSTLQKERELKLLMKRNQMRMRDTKDDEFFPLEKKDQEQSDEDRDYFSYEDL